MNVETAIQAFAKAGTDLPREAMQWALDHWDEAAPGLFALAERYASGADRSQEAADTLFYVFHLAGETEDPRAFPLLCRLARLDESSMEAIFGDAVTTTLKRILISTWDGDLDVLKGVIEAEPADEFVRSGALEVLAYLTATGRVPRDETEAYLRGLSDTLRPRHESFVWVGWVFAIGMLALESLSGAVHEAFGHGLIDPMVMKEGAFRRNLEATLADPHRMAGFGDRRAFGPMGSAISELSGWYGFSEQAKRDRERRERRDLKRAGSAGTPLPVTPSLGKVGRNDPCPCGSGKKYKRCCLG